MSLTTERVVCYSNRSGSSLSMADIRRRDMVQRSCLACGKYTMAKHLDKAAVCESCGHIVPQFLTKAEMAQHIPEPTAHCAVNASALRQLRDLALAYKQSRSGVVGI